MFSDEFNFLTQDEFMEAFDFSELTLPDLGENFEWDFEVSYAGDVVDVGLYRLNDKFTANPTFFQKLLKPLSDRFDYTVHAYIVQSETIVPQDCEDVQTAAQKVAFDYMTRMLNT